MLNIIINLLNNIVKVVIKVAFLKIYIYKFISDKIIIIENYNYRKVGSCKCNAIN